MAGMAAGLCLVGVGLTPVNKNWVEHNQLATWASEEFAVACFCYMVVTLRATHSPKRFAPAFVLTVVTTMGYVAIYLFGPPWNTPVGEMVQATAQKVVVLISIASLTFVSWNACRVGSTKPGLAEVSESLVQSKPSHA